MSTDTNEAQAAAGAKDARNKVRTERLTLDLDPELYQRVKLVAAQRHLSMRALIERLLQDHLPGLPLLVRFPEDRLRPVSKESLERLAAAREAVMQGRTFPDTSAELIREARDERTQCL